MPHCQIATKFKNQFEQVKMLLLGMYNNMILHYAVMIDIPLICSFIIFKWIIITQDS